MLMKRAVMVGLIALVLTGCANTHAATPRDHIEHELGHTAKQLNSGGH
jgi:PBP1b-binding outer membrane lipoprotein LpoB